MYCRSQDELREWYYALYGYDDGMNEGALKSVYDTAYYHSANNVLNAIEIWASEGRGRPDTDLYIRVYHKGMQDSHWGYDDLDPYLPGLLIAAGVKDLDWRRPEPILDELNAMLAEG